MLTIKRPEAKNLWHFCHKNWFSKPKPYQLVVSTPVSPAHKFFPRDSYVQFPTNFQLLIQLTFLLVCSYLICNLFTLQGLVNAFKTWQRYLSRSYFSSVYLIGYLYFKDMKIFVRLVCCQQSLSLRTGNIFSARCLFLVKNNFSSRNQLCYITFCWS